MRAAARFALGVAMVWLMPVRAVRRQREHQESFAYVCRMMLNLIEKPASYERPAGAQQRHLRLVK